MNIIQNKEIEAIIVDDEKWARESLGQLLIRYCPLVSIVGEAHSKESAHILINEKKPDLIFLDVEMPGGSGFDLLHETPNLNAKVIFTTAHNKYAITAIKLSALDYLLKPVDKDELIAAVEKFRQQDIKVTRDILNLLAEQLTVKQGKPERLAISSLKGVNIVNIKNIIYCEGDRNYTVFKLLDGSALTASKTLREYEDILPSDTFIRVHQKYLVNVNYVKKYIKGKGGTLVMEDGKNIDVSQAKKAALLNAIGYI